MLLFLLAFSFSGPLTTSEILEFIAILFNGSVVGASLLLESIHLLSLTPGEDSFSSFVSHIIIILAGTLSSEFAKGGCTPTCADDLLTFTVIVVGKLVLFSVLNMVAILSAVS
uniref:Putative product n=1 Tax=Xenopsylla cheopis TaxID=163159 RepID=A0A6M2DW73_XENCH